jgi:hypothetical protein
MSKTVLLSIIAVVIVAGGIGWYLTSKPNQSAPNSNTSATPSQQTTNTGANQSEKMSMKSLIASNTPQRCTFTDASSGANSSGTVYVASGQMRGDFTSTASGKTTQSHMVVMNETSYIWSDEMANGVKMSFADIQKPSTQQNQSVDVNKEVDYSCGPWNRDTSMFSLPAGVTFTDIGMMLRDIPSGLPTGK